MARRAHRTLTHPPIPAPIPAPSPPPAQPIASPIASPQSAPSTPLAPRPWGSPDAAAPGRPRKGDARTLRLPDGTPLRLTPRTALPLDAPPPRCALPGCERQAVVLHTDRVARTRRYRQWCAVHRPGHVALAADPAVVARHTRLSRREGDIPAEELCPTIGCLRRREIRGYRHDGTPQLRRTCETCRRGHAPAPVPAPALAPRAVVRRVMTPSRTTPSAPPPPPGSQTVRFRDASGTYTFTFLPKELGVLRDQHRLGASAFTAARAARDGRPIPDSAVTALFTQWSEEA